MLHFSVLIGSLIMSYGTGARFNQISLNTLIVNSLIIALYSILFFIPLEGVEVLMAQISMGILAVLQTLYFLYFHQKMVRQINQAITE